MAKTATSGLSDKQIEAISQALPMYKGTLTRAYTSGSRKTAINAFCLSCVGFMRNDVRDCTAIACPLWKFRPYQDSE